MWKCGDKPNTDLVSGDVDTIGVLTWNIVQTLVWTDTCVANLNTFHQSYNNNVAEAASPELNTNQRRTFVQTRTLLEHLQPIWLGIRCTNICSPKYRPLSSRAICVSCVWSVSSDIMMWRVLTGWHFVTLTGAFLCHTVTYPDSPGEGWDWAPS